MTEERPEIGRRPWVRCFTDFHSLNSCCHPEECHPHVLKSSTLPYPQLSLRRQSRALLNASRDFLCLFWRWLFLQTQSLPALLLLIFSLQLFLLFFLFLELGSQQLLLILWAAIFYSASSHGGYHLLSCNPHNLTDNKAFTGSMLSTQGQVCVRTA